MTIKQRVYDERVNTGKIYVTEDSEKRVRPTDGEFFISIPLSPKYLLSSV
jgi:hypothetical protein